MGEEKRERKKEAEQRSEKNTYRNESIRRSEEKIVLERSDLYWLEKHRNRKEERTRRKCSNAMISYRLISFISFSFDNIISREVQNVDLAEIFTRFLHC